jgi:uncharacterized integral membrane protein (TIGR00698 family)
MDQGSDRTCPIRSNVPLVAGVLFTFAVAELGILLAKLPVFSRFGSMISAILIAVLYRQIFGYPEAIRRGVQFSAKVLLRVAIVLFGFRLNLATVMREGLGLLVRDVGTVVGAIAVILLLAKWLKAETELSILLGVGTGVCGAAAIAAVSPIIGAKEDDTAIGVGLIALTGTAFTMVYTLLRTVLPLTDLQYGTWVGVSLHEIAHVAAGASPAGQDALAIALLAKLGRVLLLIPVCLTLVYWRNRKSGNKTGAKIEFPWFLAGFVATSVIGSYAAVPAAYMSKLTSLSSFLLASAMVGLGLNVSFQAVRSKALRPLLAMLLGSVLLSVVTYLTIV